MSSLNNKIYVSNSSKSSKFWLLNQETVINLSTDNIDSKNIVLLDILETNDKFEDNFINTFEDNSIDKFWNIINKSAHLYGDKDEMQLNSDFINKYYSSEDIKYILNVIPAD